jgi:hypothetical protein
MTTKSILVAGAIALALGILQSTSVALAHGHGGHGGGHHGGGHRGGGHHYGDHGRDSDGFWGGAAVGGLVAYGAGNGSRDPCNDPDYRNAYPGRCDN